MNTRMNTSTVERALIRLGEVLRYHQEVEVLLVGGAAGMLTGVLAPSRTTIDCDVMVYVPRHAMIAVETAADEVASELGLPAKWMNSDAQIRTDTLPDGWEQRKVFIGEFGKLRVFAVSRVDLIAMKVLAGRAQDLEDLRAMRMRSDDVAFVRAYLGLLAAKGTAREQIEDAMELIDSLKVNE